MICFGEATAIAYLKTEVEHCGYHYIKFRTAFEDWETKAANNIMIDAYIELFREEMELQWKKDKRPTTPTTKNNVSKSITNAVDNATGELKTNI